MSRPRTPYGPNPPGRLPATMVKVLAAELSDQGRLSRGKRYWADRAVLDIVVGHGAVTAEIQGTRSEPYVVTIEASPGAGVPGKRELWVQCTCPDDDLNGTLACKHAVAALFALSDEVAIEPDLVDRWRQGRALRERATDATPSDEAQTEPDATEIGLVPGATTPAVDDALAGLLVAPGGAAPPSFGAPEAIEHGTLAHPLAASVLRDAIDELTIRWE